MRHAVADKLAQYPAHDALEGVACGGFRGYHWFSLRLGAHHVRIVRHEAENRKLQPVYAFVGAHRRALSDAVDHQADIFKSFAGQELKGPLRAAQ